MYKIFYKLSTISTVTFLVLLLVPIAVSAINTQPTGYRAVGSDVTVTAHNVCKKVKSTDGKQYFVPTRSSSEWSTFRSRKPAGVALTECVVHGSVTFNYTGARQQWRVPQGVTSITVDARGAQGYGTTGGKGGRIQKAITVTPSELLYVHVGGAGSRARMSAASPYFPIVGTEPYNGGGLGTSGGGGASDIRSGGNALGNRKVVAGGGGGGGSGPWANYYGGGAGGGITGEAGIDGLVDRTPRFRAPNGFWARGGAGGTQRTGGAGGASFACWSSIPGIRGGVGYGGSGYGTYWAASISYTGNAGGGGYYGGGGGGGNSCIWGVSGSGGGGSSYPPNAIHIQGYQSGDGLIMISY